MFACVDVAYRNDVATAGCVLFRAWSDELAADRVVISEPAASPYRPGEFYLRELPPLLSVLKQVKVQLETIIVDGYVWLDNGRIGLGAHLYAARGENVPIIGVAKNPWRGGTGDQASNHPDRRTIPVIRGGSKTPLYITSAGMDIALAANLVAGMHGPFRIPTLLAEVDRLVRLA